MSLGDYLMWLRMRAGLSRPELGVLCGVARSTISRVERGQEPSAGLLARWLCAVGAHEGESGTALALATEREVTP